MHYEGMPVSNQTQSETHKSTQAVAHVKTGTCIIPLPHKHTHVRTHRHNNTKKRERRRVRLSSALVPGFPDQWCVVGWSMWGLSGVERANGQVSGSDTSWLPQPITTTSVNRLHHTPLLLTHIQGHLDRRRVVKEEHSQACSIHRLSP